MSDNHFEHEQPSGESGGRREMSRRQFLSYTLGGTGAFMVSMPLLWSIRFAVDPLLQPKQTADWVKVIAESEVTETPVSVKFKVHVVDGWYEHEPEQEAWIARDANGNIFALSPTCKHLGCRVEWNGDQTRFPNLYFCPCHEARYTKEGKALAVAPEPLDQYEVRLDNGYVYLGGLHPNRLVK